MILTALYAVFSVFTSLLSFETKDEFTSKILQSLAPFGMEDR